MPEIYDVVVVGAGPAGSSCAKVTSQGGLKTLLLEKQREVAKTIPCAEGISKMSLLSTLGKIPERGISTVINEARFYLPNGEFFDVFYEGVGFILERKIFDRELVKEAVLSGAELITGAVFEYAKRNENFIQVSFKMGFREETVSARVIVGADGPSSRVGKSLGMDVDVSDTDIHYAHQFFVIHPDIKKDRVLFFFGENLAPKGYGWIFPKGEGFGNVGVGVIGHKGDRVREFSLKLVNKYLRGAQIFGEISSVIPTGGHKLPLVSDRCILVGDAGRLADPLSGGGIAPAIESGLLAGEVILEGFRRGDLSKNFLVEYEKRYWSRWKKTYEFMYKVREIFLNLDDEELNDVGKMFKRALGGCKINTLDVFQLSKMIVKSSPNLLNFLKNKGAHELWKIIQEVVFE